MSSQHPVMVLAELPVSSLTEVQRLLGELASGRGAPPFANLPGTHFARLFVLPPADDGAGGTLSPRLVYSAEVDGSPTRHLLLLSRRAGPVVGAVLACCGCPTGRRRSAWLLRHRTRVGAWYVNTVGRTVRRVQDEQRLHEQIGTFLDARGPGGWRGVPPRDMHSQVVRFVAGRQDLAWACRPAKGLSWVWKMRDVLQLFVVPALALLLSPLLLVVLPAWIVALRLRESRESAEPGDADPQRLRAIADTEDRATQNPFSAVGLVKLGWLRRWTAVVSVFLLDYGVRHFYRRGSLAGVRTIHFARWVFLDDRRRMLFTSNYDGSLESYMDDFVDKLAWGLNAVFSNGRDYPRTRWLLLDGATDEQSFKKFLLGNQLPTPVWWSAYPHLTAGLVEDNSRIRAGLSRELDDGALEQWLSRL